MRVPPARSASAMRGGRAGWHQPGLAFALSGRPARIVSIFTMSNSAVFFVPAARFCPRVSFPSASRRSLPPNEGRRSAGAGHWHVRRACEARRLASRATGGRLSALHVAIFGHRTGASSSCSAHRNPRRDLAHDQAFAPGRSGPHLPRPRFAPRLGTPLPPLPLGASPETPLVSEDNRIITTHSESSQ
jgi:hypothetical protein